MGLRLDTIVIDANDPVALGRWWGNLLGWSVTVEDDDELEVSVSPPAGVAATELLFIAVPEGKSVKNRLHLDVRPGPDDDQAAEVARALSLGARHVDIGQGDDTTWVVLADPEGNEFCILRVLPSGT
jgi:hypothetical protein